jgi:hypothetical protein
MTNWRKDQRCVAEHGRAALPAAGSLDQRIQRKLELPHRLDAGVAFSRGPTPVFGAKGLATTVTVDRHSRIRELGVDAGDDTAPVGFGSRPKCVAVAGYFRARLA